MQEFREDTSYFNDDDERVLDETTMALSLLTGPPTLSAEMSDFTRTLCFFGIIFSAFLTVATLITLRSWFAWSNLLLLAFQLILVIGVWIMLLIYCVVKILSDNRTRLANEIAVEEYEEIKQQYFTELNASKRDARMRKNKALETELRLRETRVQPDPIGNYAALRDPISGQVLMLPSGNYQQPVPHSFHYHNVVPGSVKVSEEPPKGLPAPEFPAPVKFEDILRSGFTPTAQNIYLLNTVNGSINEAMSDVCHVGLAARTGGGKCLEENEAIFLADGRILPSKGLIGKMVEVVGVADTQTMQQVRVTASFSDNGVRTILEIVLDNGVVLKRTEEHPLWAARLNDDQYVGLFRQDGNKDTRTRAIQAGWVAAKDIRVCGNRPDFDGHVLLCPISLQQQGTLRRPEEDIILCAVLLAEGGLTRPSTVRFTSAAPQIVAAMSKASEVYGCEIVPIPTKGKTSVIDYRISKSHVGNENKVNLLIQEWGLSGCSALQKQVPQWVFQLPNDQIALFLRMFFDCDGWIDDGHHSYPRISVSLANQTLVQQIGQLALRLGITGTYRAKTNGHAGSWVWSTSMVDAWQRVIGSTIKAEKLADAVASKYVCDTSAKTDWNAWRRARPFGDQTFADCPSGYEWRKVVAIRSSVAPTVSIEIHNDNHAFVSHVVEHNTNTTRLLTGQFIRAGACVYLASPNFAQLKLNKNHLEDWRPIVQHLAAPPAQSDAEIRTLLLQFRQLFEHRKSVEQHTARRGADVYLILGEWPGIVKRVKEAPEIIELLLRESRQYGIHLVTEFQDALVKTLGLDFRRARKSPALLLLRRRPHHSEDRPGPGKGSKHQRNRTGQIWRSVHARQREGDRPRARASLHQ